MVDTLIYGPFVAEYCSDLALFQTSKVVFFAKATKRRRPIVDFLASWWSLGHAWGALFPKIPENGDNWSKNGLKHVIFDHFRPF